MIKNIFERQSGGALNLVNPSNFEAITQTLYDSAPLAQNLHLFQQPIGTGIGRDGTPKSLADTNMHLSGTLPFGQTFRVMKIAVEFRQDHEGRHDARTFYNSGTLQFAIGSKVYLGEAPIGRQSDMPSPEISIAFDNAEVDGLPKIMARAHKGAEPEPYDLQGNDLLLIPGQYFGLMLSGMPAELEYPARVFARLTGILFRMIA
jgi:hypothetical protein